MTACGHNPDRVPETRIVTREHYIVATPDQSLRTCKGRPAKPTLKDDSDTAVLIVDLDERGEDCSSKLGKTWQSIDDALADVERRNKEAAKK